MRSNRRSNGHILLLAVLSLTWAEARSQEVLHAPAEGRSLPQRLAWAQSQTSAADYSDGYWIGYSIERAMYENSYIGSSDRTRRHLPTLSDLLRGEPVHNRDANAVREQQMLGQAQQTLRSDSRDRPQQKVLKEVAILLRYPSGAAGPAQFDRVEISNLERQVNLEGHPLIWLGTAKDTESIPFLDSLYQKLDRPGAKKGVIVALSLHDTKSSVVPCLQKYIAAERDAKLREEIAFWLGQQDHPEALKTLRKVIKDDAAVAVRKKVVFAVSQMTLAEATDCLIDAAYTGKPAEVQKDAIFWLSQKASKKARESLAEIAFDPRTTEVHEQAVFAISQWPKDQSIPALSKISKDHPNPKIREKAIFWLGQTGDPRAVDALVEIVRMSQ